LKDEFEGQDIEHREDQVIALKEVYDTSMHNIHCRKRSGMKHFKHMLYLQEIEINPKAVNKFFEAINLKDKDPFSWEEIYAFFFATENTAETNSVLVTIKKRILAAHPKPNTSQELLKSFQRFDEDNSGKLDRYEFKALLKDFNLILDVSSERFLLAAKNFWDSDGMIEFETLSKLIEINGESGITIDKSIETPDEPGLTDTVDKSIETQGESSLVDAAVSATVDSDIVLEFKPT